MYVCMYIYIYIYLVKIRKRNSRNNPIYHHIKKNKIPRNKPT